MPLGRDVGGNIKELRKAHPSWSKERITAAALSGAREAGNTDVQPPSSIKRPRKRRAK